VQLSPFSCHFIPLGSKYSPQHPVLKHPQSMRSFTPVKTTGRIMVLYILTFKIHTTISLYKSFDWDLVCLTELYQLMKLYSIGDHEWGIGQDMLCRRAEENHKVPGSS
jgi:hypothetical protein